MKALVYTANQEMTYRDEPEPRPQAGDALVAMDADRASEIAQRRQRLEREKQLRR